MTAARLAPGCTTRVVWWIEEAQDKGFLPSMERLSFSTWRITLRSAKDGEVLGVAQRGSMENAFAHAMTQALGGGWKAPREAIPPADDLPEPDPLADIPM